MNHQIQTSKKVILDCVLENGGIVAANSTKPYYASQAKNYFYVWPRDGAYACLALDALNITGVQERYFSWLITRAEKWRETGLFYEVYDPNGTQVIDRVNFQPDQTGIVLYALSHHFRKNKEKLSKYKKLVTHSANGLLSVWQKDHFIIPTNDLWEEQLTFPDTKGAFSYSLAACIRGLLCAHSLFPDKRYKKAAQQMKNVLAKKIRKYGYVIKALGDIDYPVADASGLGVIWPFEVVSLSSPFAKATVRQIEKQLVKNYGVHRYGDDRYDGWMYQGLHRKKGAGYWPVLNFWISIVLNRLDRKKDARKYYDKVLKDTKRYIPEQIFENTIQKGVSPLCWSHSMHILAAKELGLLK